MVDKDRRRDPVVRRERADHVEPDVHLGARVERGPRDTAISNFTGFYDGTVHLDIEEFEPGELELFIDAIGKHRDLAPCEFFHKMDLELELLILGGEAFRDRPYELMITSKLGSEKVDR